MFLGKQNYSWDWIVKQKKHINNPFLLIFTRGANNSRVDFLYVRKGNILAGSDIYFLRVHFR